MAISSYLDAGFNNFLVREIEIPEEKRRDFLSEEDVDSLFEGVSGSKITSGVSRSKDGNLRVNWDKALIEFSNGLVKVFQVGKFDDGTTGIRIVNSPGNQISMDQLELVMGKQIVAGATGTARLYVDNGGTGGKNRLMVQFPGGSPRTLATQP